MGKWKEMQKWRREFIMTNGREPLVWIDKYCINQQQIEQSLACLPVYLAGCSTLVIFCGETYLQRLWCVVELMVFLEMGGSIDSVEVMLVTACKDCDFEETMQNRLNEFHPQLATCFTEEDTERLQAVLEASSAGR